jgi:hypothetical protein
MIRNAFLITHFISVVCRASEAAVQAAWQQLEATHLSEREAVQAVKESAREALGESPSCYVQGPPLPFLQ